PGDAAAGAIEVREAQDGGVGAVHVHRGGVGAAHEPGVLDERRVLGRVDGHRRAMGTVAPHEGRSTHIHRPPLHHQGPTLGDVAAVCEHHRLETELAVGGVHGPVDAAGGGHHHPVHSDGGVDP